MLYQWGCYATNSTYNWTVVGVLAYLALFQGSTILTEWVTSGKYPEYREYQARVGKFLPRLGTQPRGAWKASGKDSKKTIERNAEETETDAAK